MNALIEKMWESEKETVAFAATMWKRALDAERILLKIMADKPIEEIKELAKEHLKKVGLW